MQIALEDKKSISKKNGFLFWVISLSIILVGTIVAAIAIGSTYIEPEEVYKVSLSKLTNGEVYSDVGSVMIQNIIWEIRLPRVLLGAICGAGLAICGVLMQCVTKNPIAEPYILGISSGASCGAVFVIVLGGMSSIGINSVGAGAFVGSLISGILVFVIGTQMGKTTSTTRLVLSGMAISTIFSALTNLLIYSAENSNQAKSALFWTVGSLGGAKWEVLLFPFIILVVVIIGALVMSKSLDILLLGDDSAIILGINIKLIKSIILILATLLTSALVSITGAIGFIGLVVPHICRTITGSDHKKLIVLSSLIGAIFLIASDIIARGLFPPIEIPIGIITSLVGGPFFLYLISKKNYSFGGKE
ncbi:iron ABC transporter permease [Clostridium botulinum]|uniref:Fe uptake system integral membrane protein n=1 Tax=Clostridium botulinum (strain Eklund 17B / Type B) TaxID=935198 RepID=B2TJT5_CLOBB|nr:iron ABC transporter permease [Clostridium sp. VAP41]ACD23481.1 Fe uptake system integral membrane protein [Clostridium botulinum B str. Eklund 17B (NRP)]MBY6974714.1 iron ABC transporter permease [Clostridium botulinum]MBY6999700.1 iron ABC transporter permease [Clostridium botulinum]MCR1275067.1 iron ABC transporter permease [Clostridium botulinum]NFD70682.1 iron ABC transporter permease [Clostridium botulinum]